jgi:hypothetical protein
MTSQRVRIASVAAGAAALLALSAGAANASVHAQHASPSTRNVYISWEGPITEASCNALVAYEEKQSDTLSASCSYRDYSPLTGAYDPGWYNYLAIANNNE